MLSQCTTTKTTKFQLDEDARWPAAAVDDEQTSTLLGSDVAPAPDDLTRMPTPAAAAAAAAA